MLFVFVNLNTHSPCIVHFPFVPKMLNTPGTPSETQSFGCLVYRTVITARNYYVNVKELVKSLLATVFHLAQFFGWFRTRTPFANVCVVCDALPRFDKIFMFVLLQ